MLGLLHQIYLDEVPDSQVTKFFVGTGIDSHPALRSRIAIAWWLTRRGNRILGDLAKAIRDYLARTMLSDRKGLRDVVNTTLQDNELNGFLLDGVFSRERPRTLFDAYSQVTPIQVAETIWNGILRQLELRADEWLFVYPLKLVTAPTSRFAEMNASIVATNDDATVDSYREEFLALRALSLSNGQLESFRLSDDNTPSWLFIQLSGQDDVAFSEAKNRASTLLGLLMSAEWIERPHQPFQRSSGTANDYAALFSRSCKHTAFKAQSCGVILHAVMSGFHFSASAIDVAKRWVSRLQLIDHKRALRAQVAARWINQGAITGSHGRFLFFFFALDALYGERFNVEEKIIAGVNSHMSGNWAERCRWLFELRSELVHGGTASTSEWSKMERYVDHFDASVEQDIEEMVARSLIHFVLG